MPTPNNTSSDPKAPVRKLGRGIGALISVPAVEVPVAPKPAAVVEVKKEVVPEVKTESTDLIRYIDVGAITTNPFQPRKVIHQDTINQLAESIKHSGLMQPIIVRPASKSGGPTKFELVAGERRWRAAQAAELKQIPAIVRVLSDEQSAEWALVENVQREDLNPIERGNALKALATKFSMTQDQLAQRIGIERSSVANLIRLTDLEPQIADMIVRGDLTGGHGKALLGIPPGDFRVKVAREVVEEGWNVRKLEQFAKSRLAQGKTSPSPGSKEAEGEARRAVLRDLERQIGHRLGTKVLITTDRTGAKGQLTIEFYSIDHFDGLLRTLQITAN
jgi:ParB family chromosome partitioning protein